MEINQFRSEFIVFVIDSDFRFSETIVEALKSAGYMTRFFPTIDSALAVAHEDPPHLIVYHPEGFAGLTEEFVARIRSVSPEILLLFVLSAKEVLPVLSMINQGLIFDYIAKPFISSLEIIQKVDRGAMQLLYMYENEQLREDSSRQDVVASPSVDLAEGPARSIESAREVLSDSFVQKMNMQVEQKHDERLRLGSADLIEFSLYIEKLAVTKELEPTIQAFMDGVSRQLRNVPVVYFRYLPQYLSLVISQCAWLPIDKIRGIGFELKNEDPNRIPHLFQYPEQMEPLKNLMSEVFRISKFSCFAHQNDNETLGFLVIFDSLEDENTRALVQSYKQAFQIAYKRNLLLKEKHVLEIYDPVSGLYNRRYFRQKLDEEVSRSRRIKLPVSVVVIDLDRFRKLNTVIGARSADTILRMIGMILKKTTRATDIIARTGPDEIMFILPHTDHLGAAVKAERIRRMIETTKFPVLENQEMNHLSVSVGVSEYPSFCNDAESLLKSCDEALFQVKQAGGNRVCISTPPMGFQPDFSVRVQMKELTRDSN